MERTPSIVFLRGWQGRLPGVVDSRLSPGVMSTLVERGVARWHVSAVPQLGDTHLYRSHQQRKQKR